MDLLINTSQMVVFKLVLHTFKHKFGWSSCASYCRNSWAIKKI